MKIVHCISTLCWRAQSAFIGSLPSRGARGTENPRPRREVCKPNCKRTGHNQTRLDNTRRDEGRPNAELDDTERYLATSDGTTGFKLEHRLAGIPRYEGSNPSLSAS